MGPLRRLLHPRSIAVFGGKEAEAVVHACDGMGYAGEVWPVHPRKTEVLGRRCYRSVADLPGAPDAAFIGVNRELTIGIVRELATAGAGGAITYASGFKEVGEDGGALQTALVEAAGDMPVLGPNCYGLINYLDGALLWPDQHGGKRAPTGVAIVAQSSNIALNLTMQRRALPIAYLICLGNQAQTGLSGVVDALVEDPRVTAIGLHVEGLDDVFAFDAAARKALAARKPIVVVKTGRSEAGAALTLSHTASLAGHGAAMEALFARLGVGQVHSLTAFLETLRLHHLFGPLPGLTAVSLSCSGGEAALIADTAHGRRVRFREFTAAEAASVRATTHPLVTVSNPLDYHTFDWGKREELTRTFTAVLDCGFDAALLVLDFPRADRCDPAGWTPSVEAWSAAAKATGARAAILTSLPESLPEETAEALLADGVLPLFGFDDALTAIEVAADIGAAMSAEAPGALLRSPPKPGSAETLDEWEGKAALALAGLSHPGGRLVVNVDEARRAAAALGVPVAIKATGRTILHKTEQGAVALNLAEPAEIEAAAAHMLGLSDRAIVEPMVTDAVAELILGLGRDPQLGLYLVVGSGGVLTELLSDRAVLLLPTTRQAVEAAIAGLHFAPLLHGFRGGPEGDVEAAVDAALAVAEFAVANADTILELDVNPLLVRPVGRGAVAADVLLRRIAPERGEPAR
ncbi:MAG: acetate--CoA ligase family protein [Geminicoccaceae bacterium]